MYFVHTLFIPLLPLPPASPPPSQSIKSLLCATYNTLYTYTDNIHVHVPLNKGGFQGSLAVARVPKFAVLLTYISYWTHY